MKKQLLTCLTAAGISLTANAQQLAFPGAEGFGAYAKGGRGGTVVHVTNLNASGAGSLADAVSKPNRIVVFDVGGVIDITGASITVSSNTYIAGQTAPGEGITIYGGRVICSGASDVIIRYVRMRGGSAVDSKKCTLTLDNCTDLILDHCSISWGPWDNVHIANANNITWQNCIISEGILPQRFGAITDGTRNWTVSHCLWADNKSRNPKMKCSIQYYNNVCYNYGMGIIGGHSAADNYQDVMNNYFITGPSSGSSNKYFDQWTETDHLYSTGNYTDGNNDGVLNGTLITDYNGATPMQQPNLKCTAPMNLETAEEAYYSVVDHVGASIVRDVHDRRIISQLTSLGTEGAFIESEQDVGGIGNVSGGTPPTDTDGDGMPDEWEKANGTDPNVNDAMADSDGNGYSNIEDYINSLAKKADYLMYPTGVKAVVTDGTSCHLTWTLEVEDADAVILEKSEDGLKYEVAATLPGDAVETTIDGLVPKKVYYFRLKLVKGDRESLYSAVVTVNDEGMRAGGGVAPGTTEFVPAEGKLYRIICYATKAYNSGTTLAGSAKYLTITSKGLLGSVETFEWDNPALLWEIESVDGGVTMRNRGTGKYFSPTNSDVDGTSKIVAADDAATFTVNYIGDRSCALSGVDGDISMYRINSPSNKDQQLRPRDFPSDWLWGNGTLDRADMIYTFSEVDASMVKLFLSALRQSVEEAEGTASAAQTGNRTLCYPAANLEALNTTIASAKKFLTEAADIEATQEQIDSVKAEVDAALKTFRSSQIMTLAGYDTDYYHNIYSYGTISNSSATTADASTQRRYLVAIPTADGTADSLIFRVGLSDADIAAGGIDAVSEQLEAKWEIAYGEDGNVYFKNAATQTYLQIANLLSATPATVYPYYAKMDNGNVAFYMETAPDNTRCLNVGTPNEAGTEGTVGFAGPADRTRLRWVVSPIDEEVTDGISAVTGTDGNIVKRETFSVEGVRVENVPRGSVVIERVTYSDGSCVTLKRIAR